MTPSSPSSAAAAGLDPARLPRHVAIIMDGNGRWAKRKGWRRIRGHEEGAESVRVAVRTCRRLGIAALTLYAFSEENWARPQAEINALMRLLARFLDSERQEMIDKGIRLFALGELHKLPPETRDKLEETMRATAGGREMSLNLALSYGGRQEIVRAARRLCREVAEGRLSCEEIDQETFARHLYTAHLPDPDLLIRTSGEQRISNFLPWQLAYTEFYFTDALWPDFREAEMIEALREYTRRQRRFGRTSEQLEGSQ